MGKYHSKIKKSDLHSIKRKTYSKDTDKDVDTESKISTVSDKEIKQWYKGFMKECPRGILNLEGFKSIYRQFFPLGDPSDFATIVFGSFDENQDGFIQFEEFICALSVTTRGSLDEKLKWAFRLYDIDKDGFVTRDEMMLITTAIYNMVAHTIDLPSDEDTPTKRVDKIFELMDKNHDDKISFEEFEEGAKKDSAILEALCMYDPDALERGDWT